MLKETARKYALQNAVIHNGKAESKAVIGKIMADPSMRQHVKEIVQIVDEIISEVNSLSLGQQRVELERIAPEMLEKEKKKKECVLPPLDAEQGKVVTRFPPEPNGYLHIGHAKAAIIDHEYARIYDGKFVLRFDDTNPEAEKLEFYDAQREDLKWLGIKWDTDICTSQFLPELYRFAEQMIKQGDAYICKCSQDEIGKGRYEGKECECRKNAPAQNEREWNNIISGAGRGILRLKGDMKSQNTAMRDPTLFRLVEAPHPIFGTKYRFWPTYDFAGCIMDSISGVTHAFRTKEYELRDEVYFYILEKLGLRKPELREFARLSIEGAPVSKRLIKPLIDEGKVSGYDDPRLPTLRGLRRRGILPEAIRQFVLSQGKSKSEAIVSFELIEAFNRKMLDPVARRFFFVPDPLLLAVDGAEPCDARIRNHPDMDLGERTVHAGTTFYIPRADAEALNINEIFRLKELYNVRVISKGPDGAIAKFVGKEILPETKKIQWVSEFIEMEIIVPKPLYINDRYNPESLQIIRGYAEPLVSDLKDGDIVQFERFGFVRIERRNGKISGILAHK